jgi:hypothetical protein
MQSGRAGCRLPDEDPERMDMADTAAATWSLPNVSEAELDVPTASRLALTGASGHSPRILLLYGSLRERS